jgi:hypothetical protein
VYPATHPSRGRELAENPLIIFTLHSYTLAALKDETQVRSGPVLGKASPSAAFGSSKQLAGRANAYAAGGGCVAIA